ncbi:MAG: hypothetical protein AAF959_01680 [Cyanobacteria bacterium P01_D01_bin.56]
MSNLRKKEYLQQAWEVDSDALLKEANLIFAHFLTGVPKPEHLDEGFSREFVLGPIERELIPELGYISKAGPTGTNYFSDFAHALNYLRDVLALPIFDTEIFDESTARKSENVSELEELHEEIRKVLLKLLERTDFDPLFVYANALQLDPDATPHISDDQQRRISQCLNHFLFHYSLDIHVDNWRSDSIYLDFLEHPSDIAQLHEYMEAWKQRQ